MIWRKVKKKRDKGPYFPLLPRYNYDLVLYRIVVYDEEWTF